jgi:hypothetical protein
VLPATIKEFVLVINTMKLYLSPNLDFPSTPRFLVWEELVYEGGNVFPALNVADLRMNGKEHVSVHIDDNNGHAVPEILGITR